MPRKSKKTWVHPLYSVGYCYERYGKVYLRVKDKSKSTYLIWNEDNKNEATQLLEQFIKQEIYNVKSSPTISSVLELFMTQLKYKVGKKTYEHYIFYFKQLIKKDFELTDLIGIREHLIHNINEVKAKYKQNTVNNCLAKVETFFRYCIENDFCIKNPITPSMRVPRIKTDKYTPSLDNFNEFAGYIAERNLKLYLICSFIRYSGTRISETVNIKLKDITNDYIIIYGKRKTVKEDNIRYIPLSPFPELLELTELIKAQNYDSEFLFGKIDTTYITQRLRIYINRSELEAFTFHALRRLAIYWWKSLGINRTDRASLAGHDETIQKNVYDIKENNENFATRIILQRENLSKN
jgi:integrase